MKDEKDIKGSKGSTTNKVKKLQRQYNKILVDLFDQFAAESIEEALDKNEGSFGENIQDIVQCALDCLKGKVMDELGVSGGSGEVAIAIDGMNIGGDGFAAGAAEEMGEDEGEESEDHEESESDEFEAGEQASGDTDDEDDESDEDEEEEVSEESTSKRHTDKDLISEAYSSIYKK